MNIHIKSHRVIGRAFFLLFLYFSSISAILHLVFQNLSRFHPDHQSSLLENSQKSLLMLTDRERLDLPGS